MFPSLKRGEREESDSQYSIAKGKGLVVVLSLSLSLPPLHLMDKYMKTYNIITEINNLN